MYLPLLPYVSPSSSLLIILSIITRYYHIIFVTINRYLHRNTPCLYSHRIKDTIRVENNTHNNTI